jgi:N-acetylneuraminic acid mutarotase
LLYIVLCCGLAMPAFGQQWTFRTPMEVPRTGTASAVLDGRIYVLGGEDQFGTVLATASRYHPETDQWEQLPPMNKARVFAAALALDGNIFVIGGRDEQGAVLAEVEYYDPAQNQWTAFSPLNVERQGLTAVVRNARLFVAGGSDGQDQLLETIEVYDGTSTGDPNGKWVFFEESAGAIERRADGRAAGKNEAVDQLGTPRAAFAGVSVEDRVLFMGGFGQRGPLDLVQQLSPDGQFDELAPLPTARGNLAAAVIEDSVFVIGGHDGSDRILADVLLLDPASGAWEPMPRLNTERESSTAAVVDGVLYVIGGRDAGGRVLSSVEALRQLGLPTASSNEPPAVPDFRLEQNYPNPFEARTTITFTVSAAASGRPVRLAVYDLQGRRVATLVDGLLAPGRHDVFWGGLSRSGAPVGSGIYFYRLQQGDLEAQKMMTFVH